VLLAPLSVAAPSVAPSVAFFYGASPPWDELSAFDIVVVEPGHVPDPKRVAGPATAVYAYAAVGEVLPSRAWFKDLPAAWRIGTNPAWGSVVVDQAQPEWPAFFADRVIRPLWDAGYRGFFLDTLDSYHLVAKTDAERSRQEAGMVRLVETLRQRFPEVKLIFNRGFEILPRVHREVTAVAAESVFRGWDASTRTYREVPENDRKWLLGQLSRVRDEYRLPVIAIDYVAPAERELARRTAQAIKALGFVPWVATPELDSMGVGAIEVMPRRVLMLYDGTGNPADLTYESIHRLVATPLNYLGYRGDYLDVVNEPLPAWPLPGRYAGIVAWFDDALPAAAAAKFEAWLARQAADGVRIVLLNRLGVAPGSALLRALGLTASAVTAPSALTVIGRDRAIGYEVDPVPDRRNFLALASKDGTPLLQLRSDRGERMDAVAYTPWGGYALHPYAISFMPAEVERWVIDPFAFFRRALALPAMPVPDVTTENGSRLMLVHVDGDGFPSRAELPGTPYAGAAMLTEVLERYRVPTTVSVIQGEVAPNGLYPKLSAELEAIARKIFTLPHVEIASHSYSHPFQWQKAQKSTESYDFFLEIPGYKFDLGAEIDGSIRYINERLAPKGKRVELFLWTGDTNPSAEAVARTYAAGVRNMNGGDTTMTASRRSLTRVAPLGIPKGAWYQVYAPNQNENVYTNLWTGPYYGFERVIETFELTDRPLRLKPINIYYHSYAATKRASLASLHKIYGWALAQPVMNVYASEYVDRVLDFQRATVARDGDAWVIRAGTHLREVRAPAELGPPDLAPSSGIAGYARHNDAWYIHLSGGEARVRFGGKGNEAVPYIATANARLTHFRRNAEGAARRIEFGLAGHVPVKFTLAHAAGCELRVDGKVLKPSGSGAVMAYEVPRPAVNAAELSCPR
jgi:uncharacterized protein (TIGR01370 family)